MMFRIILSAVLLCFVFHPSAKAEVRSSCPEKEVVMAQKKSKLLCKVDAFISIVERRISGQTETEISPKDIVSDDFIREVRPDSLNQPLTNWEQYEQAMDRYSAFYFDSFDVVTDRATVQRKRVILEAHSIADVKESAGGGTYGQEYILIFEFDRKGKIRRLIEYADSLYSACFFKLIDCESP